MSSTDSTQPRSSLGRWLREPLLHFLVIGALLFVVYAWRKDQPVDADPKQIVLTEDDLLQMVVALRAQGLPDPTSSQFNNLIEVKVREEVLYREALAMGLDRNDTIVKRRMAQKMDFLAEDLSALREPTEQELRAWLAAHPEDFAYPPRATFRHVFFGFDERGERARDAAVAALKAASGHAIDAPEVGASGDRFPFQDYYADRSPDQVASVFGGGFSRILFEQRPGTWEGPVESGFGWHLVFIETLTPGRIPEFEEVENEVRTRWVANQRAEFKAAAYEVMRAKYEVILPDSVAAD